MPPFDDGGPIAFVDGECLLCSLGARLIARYDRRQEFRICPVQTLLGSAVLRHYGLDPDDPESWLYLIDGRAYTSFDAIMRIAQRVGGPVRVLQVFRILPKRWQDWLYARVARNRHVIFGRGDICAVPDPELRARLLL